MLFKIDSSDEDQKDRNPEILVFEALVTSMLECSLGYCYVTDLSSSWFSIYFNFECVIHEKTNEITMGSPLYYPSL